tara:strand:+ start:2128 stop:2472 length:345 start_codon:yes stop_codon:yes gene_type:complete
MSEIQDVEEALKIIRNQTDYSEERAQEKYEEWNGDYISVIKEYLNPNFQKKKSTKKMSVNQKMMTEIRNFMDDVNTKYDARVADKKEQEREAYLKELESTIKNAKIELNNIKND